MPVYPNYSSPFSGRVGRILRVGKGLICPFKQISDAISASQPYDRVEVESGEYYESLSIVHPLELCSCRDDDSPIISARGPCITVNDSGPVLIEGLRVIAKGSKQSDSMSVLVVHGSPMIRSCVLSAVHVSNDSAPTIKHCKIEHADFGCGLKVSRMAGGEYAFNQISFHPEECVRLQTEGSVNMHNNSILQQNQSRAVVLIVGADGGKPTGNQVIFADNIVSGNGEATVEQHLDPVLAFTPRQLSSGEVYSAECLVHVCWGVRVIVRGNYLCNGVHGFLFGAVKLSGTSFCENRISTCSGWAIAIRENTTLSMLLCDIQKCAGAIRVQHNNSHLICTGAHRRAKSSSSVDDISKAGHSRSGSKGDERREEESIWADSSSMVAGSRPRRAHSTLSSVLPSAIYNTDNSSSPYSPRQCNASTPPQPTNDEIKQQFCKEMLNELQLHRTNSLHSIGHSRHDRQASIRKASVSARSSLVVAGAGEEVVTIIDCSLRHIHHYAVFLEDAIVRLVRCSFIENRIGLVLSADCSRCEIRENRFESNAVAAILCIRGVCATIADNTITGGDVLGTRRHLSKKATEETAQRHKDPYCGAHKEGEGNPCASLYGVCVTNRSHVRLLGNTIAGNNTNVLVRGGSVVEVGKASQLRLAKVQQLTVTEASSVTVQDSTFSESSGGGLMLTRASRAIITRSTFQVTEKAGVCSRRGSYAEVLGNAFHACTEAMRIQDGGKLYAEGSKFTLGTYGVISEGTHSECTLVRCFFYTTIMSFIRASGLGTVTCRASKFESCLSTAIVIQDGVHALVEKCTMIDGKEGLCSVSSATLLLRRCIADGTQHSGFVASGSASGSIEHCEFRHCERSAVSLGPQCSFTVADCTISSSAGVGIEVFGSGVITSNTVDGWDTPGAENTLIGIKASGAATATLRSNTVRDCHIGLLLEQHAAVIVENCLIVDSISAGIAVQGSAAASHFVEVAVNGSDAVGVALREGAACKFSKCTVLGAAHYSLTLTRAGAAALHNCTFASAAAGEVLVNRAFALPIETHPILNSKLCEHLSQQQRSVTATSWPSTSIGAAGQCSGDHNVLLAHAHGECSSTPLPDSVAPAASALVDCTIGSSTTRHGVHCISGQLTLKRCHVVAVCNSGQGGQAGGGAQSSIVHRGSTRRKATVATGAIGRLSEKPLLDTSVAYTNASEDPLHQLLSGGFSGAAPAPASAAYGLRVADNAGLEMNQCHVENCPGVGFVVEPLARVSVRQSTVRRCGVGILFTDSPPAMRDRGAPALVGCVFTSESSKAIFCAVTIDDCDDAGVLYQTGGAGVVELSVVQGCRYGVRVEARATALLTHLHIHSCLRDGVSVTGRASAESCLRGLRISECGGYGVRVSPGSVSTAASGNAALSTQSILSTAAATKGHEGGGGDAASAGEEDAGGRFPSIEDAVSRYLSLHGCEITHNVVGGALVEEEACFSDCYFRDTGTVSLQCCGAASRVFLFQCHLTVSDGAAGAAEVTHIRAESFSSVYLSHCVAEGGHTGIALAGASLIRAQDSVLHGHRQSSVALSLSPRDRTAMTGSTVLTALLPISAAAPLSSLATAGAAAVGGSSTWGRVQFVNTAERRSSGCAEPAAAASASLRSSTSPGVPPPRAAYLDCYLERCILSNCGGTGLAVVEEEDEEGAKSKAAQKVSGSLGTPSSSIAGTGRSGSKTRPRRKVEQSPSRYALTCAQCSFSNNAKGHVVLRGACHSASFLFCSFEQAPVALHLLHNLVATVHAEVRGSFFTACGVGVDVCGGERVGVEDCEFQGHAEYGVRVRGGHRVALTRNRFGRGGVAGVLLSPALTPGTCGDHLFSPGHWRVHRCTFAQSPLGVLAWLPAQVDLLVSESVFSGCALGVACRPLGSGTDVDAPGSTVPGATQVEPQVAPTHRSDATTTTTAALVANMFRDNQVGCEVTGPVSPLLWRNIFAAGERSLLVVSGAGASPTVVDNMFQDHGELPTFPGTVAQRSEEDLRSLDRCAAVRIHSGGGGKYACNVWRGNRVALCIDDAGDPSGVGSVVVNDNYLIANECGLRVSGDCHARIVNNIFTECTLHDVSVSSGVEPMTNVLLSYNRFASMRVPCAVHLGQDAAISLHCNIISANAVIGVELGLRAAAYVSDTLFYGVGTGVVLGEKSLCHMAACFFVQHAQAAIAGWLGSSVYASRCVFLGYPDHSTVKQSSGSDGFYSACAFYSPQWWTGISAPVFSCSGEATLRCCQFHGKIPSVVLEPHSQATVTACGFLGSDVGVTVKSHNKHVLLEHNVFWGNHFAAVRLMSNCRGMMYTNAAPKDSIVAFGMHSMESPEGDTTTTLQRAPFAECKANTVEETEDIALRLYAALLTEAPGWISLVAPLYNPTRADEGSAEEDNAVMEGRGDAASESTSAPAEVAGARAFDRIKDSYGGQGSAEAARSVAAALGVLQAKAAAAEASLPPKMQTEGSGLSQAKGKKATTADASRPPPPPPPKAKLTVDTRHIAEVDASDPAAVILRVREQLEAWESDALSVTNKEDHTEATLTVLPHRTLPTTGGAISADQIGALTAVLTERRQASLLGSDDAIGHLRPDGERTAFPTRQPSNVASITAFTRGSGRSNGLWRLASVLDVGDDDEGRNASDGGKSEEGDGVTNRAISQGAPWDSGSMGSKPPGSVEVWSRDYYNAQQQRARRYQPLRSTKLQYLWCDMGGANPLYKSLATYVLEREGKNGFDLVRSKDAGPYFPSYAKAMYFLTDRIGFDLFYNDFCLRAEEYCPPFTPRPSLPSVHDPEEHSGAKSTDGVGSNLWDWCVDPDEEQQSEGQESSEPPRSATALESLYQYEESPKLPTSPPPHSPLPVIKLQKGTARAVVSGKAALPSSTAAKTSKAGRQQGSKASAASNEAKGRNKNAKKRLKGAAATTAAAANTGKEMKGESLTSPPPLSAEVEAAARTPSPSPPEATDALAPDVERFLHTISPRRTASSPLSSAVLQRSLTPLAVLVELHSVTRPVSGAAQSASRSSHQRGYLETVMISRPGSSGLSSVSDPRSMLSVRVGSALTAGRNPGVMQLGKHRPSDQLNGANGRPPFSSKATTTTAITTTAAGAAAAEHQLEMRTHEESAAAPDEDDDGAMAQSLSSSQLRSSAKLSTAESCAASATPLDDRNIDSQAAGSAISVKDTPASDDHGHAGGSERDLPPDTPAGDVDAHLGEEKVALPNAAGAVGNEGDGPHESGRADGGDGDSSEAAPPVAASPTATPSLPATTEATREQEEEEKEPMRLIGPLDDVDAAAAPTDMAKILTGAQATPPGSVGHELPKVAITSLPRRKAKTPPPLPYRAPSLPLLPIPHVERPPSRCIGSSSLPSPHLSTREGQDQQPEWLDTSLASFASVVSSLLSRPGSNTHSSRFSAMTTEHRLSSLVSFVTTAQADEDTSVGAEDERVVSGAEAAEAILASGLEEELEDVVAILQALVARRADAGAGSCAARLEEFLLTTPLTFFTTCHHAPGVPGMSGCYAAVRGGGKWEPATTRRHHQAGKLPRAGNVTLRDESATTASSSSDSRSKKNGADGAASSVVVYIGLPVPTTRDLPSPVTAADTEATANRNQGTRVRHLAVTLQGGRGVVQLRVLELPLSSIHPNLSSSTTGRDAAVRSGWKFPTHQVEAPFLPYQLPSQRTEPSGWEHISSSSPPFDSPVITQPLSGGLQKLEKKGQQSSPSPPPLPISYVELRKQLSTVIEVDATAAGAAAVAATSMTTMWTAAAARPSKTGGAPPPPRRLAPMKGTPFDPAKPQQTTPFGDGCRPLTYVSGAYMNLF